MSTFHSNQIVEALTLVGRVHNCNMLNGDDPEVIRHYDCLSDVKEAVEILNTILEEEVDSNAR